MSILRWRWWRSSSSCSKWSVGGPWVLTGAAWAKWNNWAAACGRRWWYTSGLWYQLLNMNHQTFCLPEISFFSLSSRQADFLMFLSHTVWRRLSVGAQVVEETHLWRSEQQIRLIRSQKSVSEGNMLLRRWEIDCGRLNKSWSVASDKSYMVAGTNPHLPLIRTNIERPATTFSLRIQTKQAIDYKYRSCEVFSSPLFASCERDLWGKKRGLKSKPTSHLWRKTYLCLHKREVGCQPAWVGFGWSWCSSPSSCIVRGAFKSNHWKNLVFCPNWGGGVCQSQILIQFFQGCFCCNMAGVPQSQPTKSPKIT